MSDDSYLEKNGLFHEGAAGNSSGPESDGRRAWGFVRISGQQVSRQQGARNWSKHSASQEQSSRSCGTAGPSIQQPRKQGQRSLSVDSFFQLHLWKRKQIPREDLTTDKSSAKSKGGRHKGDGQRYVINSRNQLKMFLDTFDVDDLWHLMTIYVKTRRRKKLSQMSQDVADCHVFPFCRPVRTVPFLDFAAQHGTNVFLWGSVVSCVLCEVLCFMRNLWENSRASCDSLRRTASCLLDCLLIPLGGPSKEFNVNFFQLATNKTAH